MAVATRFVARALLVLLGCGAIGWGSDVLPSFAREEPLEQLASHIIAGSLFKRELLASVTPQVEAAEQANPCRASALHSAVIVRTRITERAVVEGDEITAELSALDTSIRQSLACSPADPFLWTVLYWAESNQNGFQPPYLQYLRLSYLLGPNEGWIAMRRSAYALSIFQLLPTDLKPKVVAEFANLLDSGFYAAAIQIFTGPGWSNRSVLLPQLKDVGELQKSIFANVLYKDGYDVTVPGVAPRDPRPWD
jgi:hypothetical protein